MDETEGQGINVADQSRNTTASIVWHGVAGSKYDRPVMEEVLVQSEEGELRFRGVIKRCSLKRLQNMFIQF